MSVYKILGYNKLMTKKQPSPIVETFLGVALAICIGIPIAMLALDYFGILTK